MQISNLSNLKYYSQRKKLVLVLIGRQIIQNKINFLDSNITPVQLKNFVDIMSDSAECGNCRKTQSELPIPLKRCAKCKGQWYCSRECQKSDWKSHKKVCGSTFGEPDSTSTSNKGTTSGGHISNPQAVCFIPNPLKALNDGTWLHNRPKNDVFKLLVDTYRMKIEDEYVFQGEVSEDSIYSGAGPESALRHFKRFLMKTIKLDAERNQKLLPDWWSKDSFKECLQFARKDKFSNVGFAVEKNDIQEHYSQMDMPMQLRMFCENIDESLADETSEEEMY